MDCMQISKQATAILSLISGNDMHVTMHVQAQISNITWSHLNDNA